MMYSPVVFVEFVGVLVMEGSRVIVCVFDSG